MFALGRLFGGLRGAPGDTADTEGGSESPAQQDSGSDVSVGAISRDSVVGRVSVDAVSLPMDDEPGEVGGLFSRGVGVLRRNPPKVEGCCRASTQWRNHLSASPLPAWYLWTLRSLSVCSACTSALALMLALDMLITADTEVGPTLYAMLAALMLTLAGLGLLGGIASWAHQWLLLYVYILVLIWIEAVWLLLYVPSSLGQIELRIGHSVVESGLWQRFLDDSPGSQSPVIQQLSRHRCPTAPEGSNAEYLSWHAARPQCWQAVMLFAEDRIDFGLWRVVVASSVVILLSSSACM
jgi:hypothetical protein